MHKRKKYISKCNLLNEFRWVPVIAALKLQKFHKNVLFNYFFFKGIGMDVIKEKTLCHL